MATCVFYTLLLSVHLSLVVSVDYTNDDITSPFTWYILDRIVSYNSLVRLTMQSDGNLVMHNRSSTSASWAPAGWSTGTDVGDHVTLQNDGELVVFDVAEGIKWTSNSTTGTAPFRLIVSDDNAVYILDSSNIVIWSTNPSFSILETIWSDTFDENNGWSFTNDVTLPSPSVYCPNYPDNCLKLKTLSDGDNSYVVRDTVIPMYNAIQFQVDVSGTNLDESDYPRDDYCFIFWQFDGGDWILYDTWYRNEIYRDVIIDIPLPPSYTSISILLEVEGTGVTDMCYFDNAILRGIRATGTLTPTIPTTTPAAAPTLEFIWFDTMDNNDNGYWIDILNRVTFGNYADCADGSCALLAADDGNSRMERAADVSDYVDISLKVDLFADSLGDPDLCRISWRYDSDLFLDHITDYTTDGTYNDQVIAIEDPGSRTILSIRFVVFGDSWVGGDRCYFDNAILRGTSTLTKAPTSLTHSPTTSSPTNQPTISPTNVPTLSPTKQPTQLTQSPTTSSPTNQPTISPTNIPTLSPTKGPTKYPTLPPTNIPTSSTQTPTKAPTSSPVNQPTKSPTNQPTLSPTMNPTHVPTLCPTNDPTTDIPTTSPSSNPSTSPTQDPTNNPIQAPTSNPTFAPTPLCDTITVEVITEDPKVTGVDFNGLYAIDLNERPFDRPIWNTVDGLSIQYDVDQWIIDGVGGKTLSYVTNQRFPPISISDSIWQSSEEKNPSDPTKLKQVLLSCTDSYYPTKNPTLPQTEDPAKSISSNPTLAIYSTDSAENVKGNDEVVNTTSNTGTIVTIIIVTACLALCICIIIFGVYTIYYKLQLNQNNVSEKHIISVGSESQHQDPIQSFQQQRQYQQQTRFQTALYEQPMSLQTIPQHPDTYRFEPENVMILRPPQPPPVPVHLQMSNRNENEGGVYNRSQGMGFEGNNDVIITPNGGEPNIAPDEFVVVGDDENNVIIHGMTETGEQGQYDDEVIDDALYVTAGSGVDPYFGRMLNDDAMVQEMVMDDIVEEMNENQYEDQYNASPNTFVTPM